MEDKKFELVLVELKKIFDKIEKNSEQVEERFEQIDEKFEQIDEKFEQIDARFDEMDKKLDDMNKNISGLRADNIYEHGRIYNMLSCLNSAFLRFETEQKDKFDILFEGDKERKEHQIIYAHEFTRLNDLVAKNSFRISNLEQHQ